MLPVYVFAIYFRDHVAVWLCSNRYFGFFFYDVVMLCNRLLYGLPLGDVKEYTAGSLLSGVYVLVQEVCDHHEIE